MLLVSLIFPRTGSASDKLPVLEKLPSGNLIITGRYTAGRRENYPRRRRFNYDRPSMREFKRRDARPPLRSSAEVSGTRHVALIRIGFNTDRKDGLSSLDINAGEGGFILEPDQDWIIDPPPHDRDYFNAHMTCLRNYYHAQSCGRLDITWEIFPAADNSCYKLSDLADYGPGSGMWTTGQLVDFVHASLDVADPDVDYTRFDAVIIAHAGPNLQSDVNNDTPNDVPSFFARLGDEDRFETGDGLIITDCSVIPETGIQDGYYSGISAVLAHEFGHQLGLPDLYDITSGGTGIGIWGNMGSGGQLGVSLGGERIDGIIPAGLSAWSRYYLGWVEADTVESFREAMEIPAVEKVPAEIIRIDISNDEYFLIENRCVEIDQYLTLLIADQETGVVLGVYNCKNCTEENIYDDGFIYDLELSTEYDCLLPVDPDLPAGPFDIKPDFGPGLLIWHIDERLIASRWEDNTLNSREPFSIRLMEAGGVLDIGDPTSPLSYGNYDDAYYQGNSNSFSDVTIPGAWSNMGVPSGVTVENISARDTVMTFDGGRRAVLEAGNIFADTLPAAECLLPVGSQPGMLAVDHQGNGWLDGMPFPVFSIGSSPLLPSAYGPGFALGGDAVIIGDAEGYIHAISISDWSEAGGNWPVATSGLSAYPVVMEMETGMAVAAADEEGRISVLNSSGVEEYSFQLPSGQVNAANISAVVDSAGLTGRLIFLSAGDNSVYLWWWNFILGESESVRLPVSADEVSGAAALAAGDILPGKTGLEVYLTALRAGKIYLCSADGVIFERDLGQGVQPPAVVDINGDTVLDIVVTDGESIYAISASGANLTGWPRKINGMHNFRRRQKIAVPVSAVGSGGGARVIAVSTDGIIFTLDHRGELLGGGYPERIAGSVRQAPLFVDMGGEGAFGFIDVLENGTGEYYQNRPEAIRVKWRSGPFRPDEIATSWFGSSADAMRRSFATGVGRWSSPSANWAAMDDNLIIYPNPVEGGRAGFQFRAPSGSHASLMVFNISGEIVLQREKRCEGGEEHEIPVQLSGTGSGVYIARLVITSGGRSFKTLKKFAVVN
ncbi:MAG: immune inhibitor A [Candidatus Krumholzibacteriales bacterium]